MLSISHESLTDYTKTFNSASRYFEGVLNIDNDFLNK